MAWYRTYRPQTIEGLHLPVARKYLEQIRDSGSFAHAYLFSGPKGTGKTSSARILAKLLNCEKNAEGVLSIVQSGKPLHKAFVEPCGECVSCKAIVDGRSVAVVEMDAASNRGIDDVRLLKDRAGLAPSDGRVTVFIIDEVHMLTTEAFNALLKILEEPPRHVVFALATTELHKVPETILSRCMVIQFGKASDTEISGALQNIAEKESIEVSKDVLQNIAQLADGSFRDAVKYFEQIAVGKKKITLEDAESVLQLGTQSVVRELEQALLSKNLKKVSEIFSAIDASNKNIAFIQKTVLQKLHESLVGAVGKPDHMQMVQLIKKIHVSPDPYLPFPNLPFELACLEWCIGVGEEQLPEPKKVLQKTPPQQVSQKPQSQPVVSAENAYVAPTPPVIKVSVETAASVSKIAQPEPLPPVEDFPEEPAAISFDQIEEKWPEILREVKKASTSLEALLRSSRPLQFEHGILSIEVFYSFHKEQLEMEKNMRIIENVLLQIFGLRKIRLSFSLGVKRPKEPAKPSVQDQKLAENVADAFL